MITTKDASVHLKRLSPALMHIFNALFDMNESKIGAFPADWVITSINDSTSHSARSKHYDDKAVDLRSKNFDSKEKEFFRSQLEMKLGPLFTVILENKGKANEHFHIQVKKGSDFP